MATYEAVFLDGTIAAFEADSMDVEDGLVVLGLDGGNGKRETVCVVSGADLLFIRDTRVEVEVGESDGAWEDE